MAEYPADGNEVLDVALAQLGQNGSKYQQWYGLGRDDAWCAAFVDWVYANAGFRFPITTAFVPSLAQWARDAGYWRAADDTSVTPGSPVCFEWGANSEAGEDHVGVLRAHRGDVIDTVEGNAGGQRNRDTIVNTYTRGIGLVAGFIDITGGMTPFHQPSEEDELMAAKDEIIGAVSAKIDDLSRQIATATNLEINADADVIRQLSAASEAAKSNIVAYLSAVDKQDTDAAVAAVAGLLQHATAPAA